MLVVTSFELTKTTSPLSDALERMGEVLEHAAFKLAQFGETMDAVNDVVAGLGEDWEE